MNYGELGLLVISLVASLVLGLLIPLIRSKTTMAQRGYANMLVNIAVFAAEQLYKQSGMGPIKKEAVIKYLATQGIKLSSEDLEMLIEAAVKQLNLAYEQVFED